MHRFRTTRSAGAGGCFTPQPDPLISILVKGHVVNFVTYMGSTDRVRAVPASHPTHCYCSPPTHRHSVGLLVGWLVGWLLRGLLRSSVWWNVLPDHSAGADAHTHADDDGGSAVDLLQQHDAHRRAADLCSAARLHCQSTYALCAVYACVCVYVCMCVCVWCVCVPCRSLPPSETDG